MASEDLGSLVVRIETNLKNFNKGMDNVSERVDRIGGGVRKLGGIIAGAFAVGAIVNFGKKGIQLASDLREVQNVVDTTFGAAADKINEFASTAIEKFGLSELQAKQFAGTMGAMLKSSGLAGDKVVEMSTSLTGLAGDFASFYNLPHDVAWEKLRAGIAGETAPLQQLGINMTVANLEAFALSQGINKAWTEMTQAEQVTLRYNYLMTQSKDAQGDFNKTQDSFANLLRTVSQQLDGVIASLADKLLPKLEAFLIWIKAKMPEIKETATNTFNNIAAAINFFRDNANILIPVIAGLTSAILAQSIIGGITKLYKAWQLATATQTTAQWLLNAAMTANPIGLVAAAIGALIAVGVLLWKNWDVVKAKALELWGKITETWDGIKTSTINTWNSIVNSITNFFTVDIPNAFNKFVDFFARLPGRIQAFLYDLYFVKIPYAVGYGIGFMLTTVSEGVSKIIQWFKDLPGNIWTWLQETITKLGNFGTTGAAKASDTGKSIINGVINFVKDLPTNLWNLLVTAGQKLSDFISTAKKAAGDIGEAIFDGIVDFVKSIPEKISDIFSGILESIRNIKQAVSTAFSSAKSGIEAGSKAASGPNVPKLAEGTKNFRGGLAMVGEVGRELVNLPRGSQVIPNRQTESILGGIDYSRLGQAVADALRQSPVVVNANVNSYIDGQKAAKSLWPRLVAEKDRLGVSTL